MSRTRMVVAGIIGVVFVGVAAWFLLQGGATPDAYATVGAACTKADTVTSYDVTLLVGDDLPGGGAEGRISLAVSDNGYLGESYVDETLTGRVLLLDEVFYFQEIGAEWEISDYNPLGDLSYYPYVGTVLCPESDGSLADVTYYGEGTAGSASVKQYVYGELAGTATGHPTSGRQGIVYSIDQDGWLRQVEEVSSESQERTRYVFSGLGEDNPLPPAPVVSSP